MILWALACADPDPDALLRQGRLEEAGAAAGFDPAAPVAQILAGRARRDPSITVATVREAIAAVTLLDGAPQTRTQTLDVPIERLADLGAAADVLAEGARRMAIGRSETLADQDPWTHAVPLPWKGGRLVGSATTNLESLGARLDADPPVKLVTVGLEDTTGRVYITLQHRDGEWDPVSASDAEAGARLALAAGAVRDYGGAALRARMGGGLRAR